MSNAMPDATHVLNSIFQNSSLLVVQLDAAGSVNRVSDAFRRQSGLGEGDAFADCLDPFTASRNDQFFEEMKESAESQDRVFHHSFDGDNRPYAWTWTTIRDADTVTGFVGLGRPSADEVDRLRGEIAKLRADEERRSKEIVRLRSAVENGNHVDELTGLGNRRYILDRLETEVPRAIRYDEPLTMMLFDIDHLDGVNEDFGQAKGDEVLQEVARVVQEQVRNTDYAARYDGEQFMVVCPHTDRTSSQFLAERLRRRICELTFHAEGREFGITISTGVLTVRAGTEFDVEAIVRAANDALQGAKNGGRNRVQVVETR